MRPPHAGRVAVMRAVAAIVIVPMIWSVRAVSKMPSPTRACQCVEREAVDVRVAHVCGHLLEHAVLPVDIEIFDGCARAVVVRSLVASLPLAVHLAIEAALSAAALEMLCASLLKKHRLPVLRGKRFE